MTEDNSAIARGYVERILNEKKLDQFDQIVAQDVKYHSMPELASGEAVKAGIAAFLHAFPDFNATIEDTIAERDRVVHRYTFSGTFRRELYGMPPAGKHYVWPPVDFAAVLQQPGEPAAAGSKAA